MSQFPYLRGDLTINLESGETMRAAGLKAIDTVVSSSAVLVRSKKPSNQALVNLIASRIRGVISKCPTLPTYCKMTRLISYQPLKNTSSASTTSKDPDWLLPQPLPRANVPQQSSLWTRRVGLLSVRWLRRRILLPLWIN